MPFTTNVKTLIDAQFHTQSFADIVKAPLGALGGIGQADGQKLMEALDVKTIGELATSRYVLWAQSIEKLARFDRGDVFTVKLSTLIDPKFESKRLREIAKMSPAVLVGISDKKAKMMEEAAQIRTVEELATNRFVLASQVIAHLAMYEKVETIRKAA